MQRLKKRICTALGVCLFVVLLVAGCGRMNLEKNKNTLVRSKNYTTEQFGENTYIFSPEDDPAVVTQVLDRLWDKQETNQFGEERYAIYFLPGEYDSSIAVKTGFYTQVAGLGALPTDTKLASLNCDARWLGEDDGNHNACCNFWRGVENLEVNSDTMWAVSQATFLRRVKIDGSLYLHDDYGWCSGGFLADSLVTRMIDSGSQQQWLSRNNDFSVWMGENWNLVFTGDETGADPEGTWPAKSYTSVVESPQIQEKPFLIYDEKQGFMVSVPVLRTNAVGISWKDGETGEKIPLDQFYVAKAKEDSAESLNKALAKGKNLLFTPGIYNLDEALKVENPDTILLGMGLATLHPVNGNACIETADTDGIMIAGLLLDAGENTSENMMVIGTTDSRKDHSKNPIVLSDLFFRVGGAEESYAAKAKTCLTINSNQVIGDNFWIWRADHGSQVGWNLNMADTGIIVNGADVTIYALMVEHFEKYQTIWNGENGHVYMYQSELPYDVPEQEKWVSHDGKQDGYPSILVSDKVQQFESYGIGIYSYHRDARVEEYCAMEVPDRYGIKIHNICTVMLNGYPGISHVVNDSGDAANTVSKRCIITEYENGEK